MRLLFEVCGGIDVHKETLYVCLLSVQPDGPVVKETRSFGTTTAQLLSLLDWLTRVGCQSVAMESTGVYWKPVFNVLEGGVKVVLVNAQHVKGLPGRKTDVQDCEWLAELHLHGLVRASFIPPREIRELRDLVRTRTKLIAERAQHVNRIQKVLEDANIKLGSVAADVLGVSGRLILDQLVAGQTDPTALAELARGRLRSKREALRQALEGRMRPHHRVLLRTHLQLIDSLDAAVAALTEQIEQRMRPFAEVRDRLDAIPGIGPDVATIYISEMGVDSSPWPTNRHAASWVGLCPGHDQSAGKRRSGRTRQGNRWLKTAFVQAAWSAQRATGTYMQAHFRRVCSRRGAKKAAVAVGHSLFVRCLELVRQGTEYRDLGGAYFDQRRKDIVARRMVKRLEDLGFDVTLNPKAAERQKGFS
jgi:transposase